MRSRLRGGAAIALAFALTGMPGGARVEAHALLVRSTPAARDTVSRPPSRVDLWFSEPLEAAFSAVSVWNAAGARVDKRDGAVAPGDPKRLSVTLDAVGAGIYTVRFRVLSVDGHVVEAAFVFTVAARP